MNAIVGGVPLVVVMLGMVELSKRVGVSGRALLIESFLLGLGFGMSYQCSLSVPGTFAGWFSIAIYGAMLGLATSGINDWAGAQALKAGQNG